MSDFDVRQVVLSTDDLDESIRFYTETLGFTLKFRDGHTTLQGVPIGPAPRLFQP